MGSLPTAPTDWYYHSFPLTGEGAETLLLEWVARVAHERINRAEEIGDEAVFGPTLHWAHLLKVEQSPEGDWPSRVNARTGAPIGSERTREPGRLLERLGMILQSSEFDAAVALAAGISQRIPIPDVETSG